MDNQLNNFSKINNLSKKLTEDYLKDIFELTDNELIVYFTILKNYLINASEISIKSGLPRTRIYNYTLKLIRKGLIKEINGPTKNYFAIDIEKVIDNYKNNFEKELTLKLQRLEIIKSYLIEMKIDNFEINNQYRDIFSKVDFNELMSDVSNSHKKIVIISRPLGGVFPWTEGAYAIKSALSNGACFYYFSNSKEINSTFITHMERIIDFPGLSERIIIKKIDKAPGNIICVDENVYSIIKVENEYTLIKFLNKNIIENYFYLVNSILNG